MNPDTAARGLGWFSIGLGVTELIAAEKLAGALGMKGSEKLIRLYGAREIMQGIGCLSAKPPTSSVWARVAGDALDIATLLPHASPSNPKRHNVGIALAAVVGVTAMDVLTGVWLCEGRGGPITRFARRSLERLERDSEQRMLQRERQGGQYASELAADAAR